MGKSKWYESYWIITILFTCWFLIFPPFLALWILSKRRNTVEKLMTDQRLILEETQQAVSEQKYQYFLLETNITSMQQKHIAEIEDLKEKLEREKLIALNRKDKIIQKLVVLQDEFKLKEKNILREQELAIAEKEREFLRKQELEKHMNLAKLKLLKNIYEIIKNKAIDEKNQELNEYKKYGIDDVVSLIQIKKKLIKETAKLTKQNQQLQEFKSSSEDELEQLKMRIKDIVSWDAIKSQSNQLKNELKLLCDYKQLKESVKLLKEETVVLEDEILYQSFGFYEPKYRLQNSEEYKSRLQVIRNKQKEMVKSRSATLHNENWLLDGDARKGKAMNNDNIKMTIRSFNNECNLAISRVKFNNINEIEKQIHKSHSRINHINRYNNITIRDEYVELKLQEMFLVYEYEQKKQDEKEEQRRIKEMIREEQKVLEEIRERKEKVEKEEKHFKLALEHYKHQFTRAMETERAELLQKIKEMEIKLAQLQLDKEDVENWEQNTRAGYVYIISNIGSFGENVFKIGVTRRLAPEERIRELSGASVPFPFDIHGMIFSEDAPKLENELHKAFHYRRVNKINERKEFFAVTLHEIEHVVKKNHNKTVEFTKLADAQQYRETKMLENKIQNLKQSIS